MSARSNDTAKSCSDLLVVLMLAMSAVGTERTFITRHPDAACHRQAERLAIEERSFFQL